MNKPLKAALLSALILPGSGHFLLQSKFKGMVLAGIALLCHYLLISTMFSLAQRVSIKIQNGEIPLNIAKISEAVLQQTSENESLQMTIATYLLVICWLFSIVDSYRIGWSQRKQAEQVQRQKMKVLATAND